MARFKEIKQITQAHYQVHVPWDYMKQNLERYRESYGLVLEPEFQRHHVWTPRQRTRFVEWCLRNGQSGREILFNCPGWMGNSNEQGPVVLVDGLQRLTSVLMFMANEVEIFGGFKFLDFQDRLPMTSAYLIFRVNNLRMEKDVLQWYLDVNSGGTVHTDAELDKVRTMLKNLNG